MLLQPHHVVVLGGQVGGVYLVVSYLGKRSLRKWF